MLLLEGSTFTINEQLCTFEFQPSADQAWQSWAANEVSQAATYPSVYANVNKTTMAVPNGTIGATWQPPSQERRAKDVKKVTEFRSKLDPEDRKSHAKLLDFLAENGMRTLGEPRIGAFVERLRPEPLHCEINSWQHFLCLVYLEAIQRGLYDKFIEVLANPVSSTSNVDADVPRGQSYSVPGSTGAGARVSSMPIINEHNDTFNKSLLDACEQRCNPDLEHLPGLGLKYLCKYVK